MYSSINLILYNEKGSSNRDVILKSMIQSGILFKELNSLPLLFSAIKNPKNLIVVSVKSNKLLNSIEQVAKLSHNYQNRMFMIYSTPALIDHFFSNFCLANNIDSLNKFLSVNSKNLQTEYNTSNLLNKLIVLELQKLDISPKYVGFNYLASVLTNVFANNFYSSNYIDLFECVAYNNLSTIDTIERSIRHMLSTTWKNSDRFKSCLKSTSSKMSRPSAKAILNALIVYMKTVI